MSVAEQQRNITGFTTEEMYKLRLTNQHVSYVTREFTWIGNLHWINTR